MKKERVAVLVSPVKMRSTADYQAAFRLAEERNEGLRVVPDAELWSSSKEFGKTYKTVLGSLDIANFYILTVPDGTVGRGIYVMWDYLSTKWNTPTTALFPTEEELEEIEDCALLVVSPEDSARYAVPVPTS